MQALIAKRFSFAGPLCQGVAPFKSGQNFAENDERMIVT